MKNAPRTETLVLVKALRELAQTIISEDGVANAAIAEAAERIHEQTCHISAMRWEIGLLINLLERLRTAGDTKHCYVESRSGNLIHVARSIESARELVDGIEWLR